MPELNGQFKTWDTWMLKLWDKIRAENVRVYQPTELQNDQLNMSLVLKVPEKTNAEMFRRLDHAVPDSLKFRILLQNWQWYHITIQWAPEEKVSPDIRQDLIRRVQETIEGTSAPYGDIRLPFLGDGGLMAGFFSYKDGEIAHLKRRIQRVWHDYNISLGLPTIYDETAYISMSRFLGTFDPSEQMALRAIPTEILPQVKFNSALLVVNDKVMTPERTQILLEANFKN